MLTQDFDFSLPFIIGSDEVGSGAIAGPFVVGACRTPKDWCLEGLRDSKELSRKQREVLVEKLQNLLVKNEIHYTFAVATPQEIDQHGHGIIYKLLHQQAIEKLNPNEKDLVIVDGNIKISLTCQYQTLIGADKKIPAVMAASVLAKVFRDDIMQKYHQTYPEYGFESHVGYVTKKHLVNLKKFGPCEIHRKSTKPVQKVMENKV